MVKRFFLLASLFVFVFLASGCTVVRGTTGAIGGLTTGALEGGREGFKEDVEAINKANRWVEENQGFLSRADNWVKDNLW